MKDIPKVKQTYGPRPQTTKAATTSKSTKAATTTKSKGKTTTSKNGYKIG